MWDWNGSTGGRTACWLDDDDDDDDDDDKDEKCLFLDEINKYSFGFINVSFDSDEIRYK